MNLNQLLQNIQYAKLENFNPNILGLSCCSNQIQPGFLFACLKGSYVDGHQFAENALNLGASAILVEKNLNLPKQVLVKNSHLAYAQICANFFDNPADKLKLIGVTGTNGKTTTTKLIKNILQNKFNPIGLMGTIQNEIGVAHLSSITTTPTHFEFQKLLKQMLEQNCKFVVMEVSSHALEQYRTGTTTFEIGIFLNLTQDHLDYHINMENYFNAKKKLFNYCKQALICVDDENGEQLAVELKNRGLNVTTFSTKNSNATYYADNIKLNATGVQYFLKGPDFNLPVFFATPGLFSVQNSMAAIACCVNLGIEINFAIKSITLCDPIKGRSEIIKINQPFTVICDYAHSPDGLFNILNSIKSYCVGKIITVFGCGGDRDKIKRPIMGETAAKNSDFVVITSDNPRTEDPEQIVNEIEVGLINLNTPYVKIVDRKKAIEFAMNHAKKNDVVLIAGKGHELFQTIGKNKIEFNEPKIVQQIAQNLKNN